MRPHDHKGLLYLMGPVKLVKVPSTASAGMSGHGKEPHRTQTTDVDAAALMFIQLEDINVELQEDARCSQC